MKNKTNLSDQKLIRHIRFDCTYYCESLQLFLILLCQWWNVREANWWREIIAIPLTNIAVISNFISVFQSEIF